MDSTIHVQKAPPANLVVPHYMFGALSFLVSAFLLALSAPSLSGHYFQPYLLAITHLLVLGWGTMIIFGALYQVLPVISDVPLYSILLARLSFWSLAAGVIMLVISFWQFTLGGLMHTGSSLILISVLLFVINIYKSASRANEWKIETDLIVTSVFWLFLTVVFGLVLALNLKLAFLPASHLQYLALHAHMGIAGWFILLIMGVSSKLVPMFLLSHHLNKKPLKWAYYLVNSGLAVFIVFTFFIFQLWVIYLSAILIVGGIISYLLFTRETWLKRKRKKIDPGMKMTMLAFIILVAPVILAFIIPLQAGDVPVYFIRISMVYGVSIILGFVTALILGQTFKTLPFIIWMHRHRKRVPGEELKLPAEMYSGFFSNMLLIVYPVSLLLIIIGIISSSGIIIQAGTIALLITAVIYVINVTIVLSNFKGREDAG